MNGKLLSLLCFLIVCMFIFPAIAETATQMSSSMTVKLYIPSSSRINVTITCGLHGSMLIDDEPYAGNQTTILSKDVSFTVTAVPDEGYELSEVTTSIEEGVSLVGNTLYVTNTKQDITIKIKFVKAAAHIHTPVVDDAVPATCTDDGLTEGSHCSECSAVITAQEIVPAMGHEEEVVAGTSATCEDAGLTDGMRCSRCEEMLVSQEIIPALGHQPITDSAVDATCTETGLTEGSHCSVCNEVLISQTVIAALGHQYVVDQAIDATCTNTGLTAGFHCAACQEKPMPQQVIPILPHEVVTDAAVKASYTSAGLSEGSHCSVCNTVLVDQKVIPALGYISLVEKNATLQLGTDDPADASIQLTAIILPENAQDHEIIWSSSNTNVATVMNGLVTAHRAGLALITAATPSGYKITCMMTVVQYAESIVLSPESITLVLGQTEQQTIEATVLPDNAVDKTIVWTSSAPDIASVEDGCITAHSFGVAIITAEVLPNRCATCIVNVVEQIDDSQVLRLPNYLTRIESEAFANVAAKAVIIPATVTSIADDAFAGCTKLAIYGKSGSVAEQFAMDHGFPFVTQ